MRTNVTAGARDDTPPHPATHPSTHYWSSDQIKRSADYSDQKIFNTETTHPPEWAAAAKQPRNATFGNALACAKRVNWRPLTSQSPTPRRSGPSLITTSNNRVWPHQAHLPSTT